VVRAEVRSWVKVGRDDIMFGFVEPRSHGAHWFLGNVGNPSWMMSKEEAPWR